MTLSFACLWHEVTALKWSTAVPINWRRYRLIFGNVIRDSGCAMIGWFFKMARSQPTGQCTFIGLMCDQIGMQRHGGDQRPGCGGAKGMHDVPWYQIRDSLTTDGRRCWRKWSAHPNNSLQNSDDPVMWPAFLTITAFHFARLVQTRQCSPAPKQPSNSIFNALMNTPLN